MNKDYPEKPMDPRKEHTNNTDLPLEESARREHPGVPTEPMQEERDYVAESNRQGEGIYDESLFDEKDPVPPSPDRETALAETGERLPATEAPQPPGKSAENETTREEPKQVLPGNHDLTDEEFSQVARHPHPTNRTETPGEAEISEKEVDAYVESIGEDKNLTRLDKAIKESNKAPDADHPHMHDAIDNEEQVELQKDREMNEADRFNVFKQSRYRGDQ